MLEINRRMEKGIPGAPQTRLTHAAPYFDKLKQHLDETQADLPCWHGEMYFEYHRGVFTSQGRNKRANRAAEFANLTAETAGRKPAHRLCLPRRRAAPQLGADPAEPVPRYFTRFGPGRDIRSLAAAVRRDPRVRCQNYR